MVVRHSATVYDENDGLANYIIKSLAVSWRCDYARASKLFIDSKLVIYATYYTSYPVPIT